MGLGRDLKMLVAASTAFALAFAPVSPVGTSSPRATVSMMAKSKAIPFLDAPPALDGSMVGDQGFDPLLLSNVVPLKWAREAELKHGRVCMLAWAGYVFVDFGLKFPSLPQPMLLTGKDFPSVSSLEAHDAAVDNGSFILLLWLIAVVEILGGIPKVFQLLNDPDAAPPGDYKFDPLGFGGGPDLEEKEISNGRLAMMAFSGIVTQAAITEGPFPYTYNGVSEIIPPLQMQELPGICASGLKNYCF